MIDLEIAGQTYPYPSGASDVDWAAKQVAAMQAIVAALGSGGSGGGINASSFGVLPSNSGLVNSANWATALAAAAAADETLLVDPGDYDFNGHDLSPSFGGAGVKASLIFNQSVTVRGSGRGITNFIISGWVEPTYTDPNTILAQNDNTTALIVIQPIAGIEVKLSDLTIVGPPEADLTHALSNVWGIYAGGGGALALERVDFENFNQSIKFSNNQPAYPGTGTHFTAFDCYNQFRGNGVLHIGTSTSEDFHDQLRCRHRYQDDLTNLISGALGEARHCLYVENGVSLRTVQNTFLATGGDGGESGCAWRHYSVGGVDVPKYSESIGDVFLEDCAAAIIPNPNFVSTILGATVHTSDRAGNTAIQCPGPVIIDGLHMIGDSATSFGISDGAFTGGRVSLSNALIEGDWVYALSRINDVADRWSLKGVEFRCTSSGGGGALRILGGGMDADGLLLDVTGGAGGSIFFKGGDFKLTNVRSVVGCEQMVIAADDADVSIDFGPGVTWDDATETILTPAANDVALTGAGLPISLSNTPAGTISGSLQCARGVSTYTYDANRIVLRPEGDTFVINEGGSVTVNSINMAGSLSGTAVADDLNAPYQATVRLYVAQTFALGSGGNIVANGGLRPVGSVITLTYINTLGTPKWVEVTQNLVLNKNITVVGSGADTTEDNLMTYSLPASVLSADAKGLRVTAWGDGVNTSDVTTIKGYFGATAVVTKVLTAAQANTWWAEFEVFRTGAATQTASGTINNGGTVSDIVQSNAAPTETLSGAVTIKFTGQRTVSSVANSLRQLGMVVELLP